MLLLKVQLQLRQQPSAGRPGKQPRGRAVEAPVAVWAPPQPVPLPGLPPPSLPLSSPGLEAPPTSPLLLPPDDPPPPLMPGPALSPRPPPVVVLRLLQRLESAQPSPSLAASG